MNIVIRFAPNSDDEEAALIFARRLFAVYDDQIDELALIPTAGVDFTVSLNGRLVHSSRERGRPPRLADLACVEIMAPRQLTSPNLMQCE